MLQPLAFLLLTSLTLVGLLSTWAATSPRHWFLRTSVVVGVLALLILIPAYEPLVAFVLQAAVVATGVQWSRWWQWRREGSDRSSPRAPRFSLASLMLVTVFVAAVAVQLPALNFLAWQSVVLIGLVAGIATLLALWMVYGQRFRWWLRVLIGLFLALIVSPLLVWADWFVYSLIELNLWPPGDPKLRLLIGIEDNPEFIWVLVIIGTTSISCMALWLIAGITLTETSFHFNSRWKRILSRCVLFILAIWFLIPPASTYYHLMTPEPIPQIVLPNPNGWDDLVAAGVMIEKSKEEPILSNYDTATQAQLSTAVAATAPVYDRLAVGLERRAYCPVTYDLDWDAVQSMGTLARAVAGRSLLAKMEGRFADAADSALEGIRFGYQTRQGGLILDSLVGNACSGIARHSLYDVHKELSASRCLELIATLSKIDKTVDPAEEIIHRDQLWTIHSFGWHGHLQIILNDEFGTYDGRFEEACNRERATMRLLQVELALQAWRQTHDSLPEALDELVPEILEDVPIDPFDPDEGPLRYRRTNEDNEIGYLLYSIGYNAIDEDGAVRDEDDLYEGDLRLDVMYAPEPEPSEEEETF